MTQLIDQKLHWVNISISNPTIWLTNSDTTIGLKNLFDQESTNWPILQYGTACAF